MKKKFSLILYALAIWLTTTCTLQAQVSGLGPLVGQLDSAQRAAYFRNLDSLMRRFNVDSLNLNTAIDSLNRGIFGRNPLLGIGDSTGRFTAAIDSFFRLYRPTDTLGMRDRDSLLREINRLKNVSIPFADSLKGLFGFYRDSLISSTGIPLANYPLNDSIWGRGRDTLKFLFKNLNDTIAPKGFGNFAPVFNFLFNRNNFRLELFTGIQNAQTAYFALRQKLEIPVIGIRTVEQFDRLWEQHWQAQASFNMTRINAALNDGRVFVAQEALSPQLLQLEYAIMFNPILPIFSNANRSVRLISSLGMEASIYAPAHINYNPPRDLQNKGFTTGLGPQIGAGFSLKLGSLTAFSLGTMSYGNVIRKGNNVGQYNNTPYTFFSTCISAGVRYGNAFSLRYENRTNDWINNIKTNVNYTKFARVSQITVGIPLNGLTR